MPATYSPATVKRARTILANCERQQQSRNARATAAVKAVKDANAWRKRPASDAQIRRVSALENDLGYRVSGRRVIRTAGQASDLYQSLKREALEAGIR